MDIPEKKKDRGTIKGHFVTGAIPTQRDFEELIDSVMFQRDDCLVKRDNEALSIASDKSPEQKLINFYTDFSATDPAWVFSINPLNAVGGNRSGFCVGDGAGNKRLFIDADTGSLGIGTTEPMRKLHVHGSEIHSGGEGAGLSFGDRSNELSFVEDARNTNGQRWLWYCEDGMARLWSGSDRIRVDPAGNLFVLSGYLRCANDAYVFGKLEVTGMTMVHDSVVSTKGTIAAEGGSLFASEDVIASRNVIGGNTKNGWKLGNDDNSKGDTTLRLLRQDVAEYHDFAVGKLWAGNHWLTNDLAEITPIDLEAKLELGDVVVIDPAEGLRVTKSNQPYDTKVYGVVSSFEQAALVIGRVDSCEKDKTHLPIALVGRVKVKVSAENGPISVGDLLTTSGTPGHAMRCGEGKYCSGAIVGKALEAHGRDLGVITVVVTLQ